MRFGYFPHFIVMIFVFTIDVRVRAGNPSQANSPASENHSEADSHVDKHKGPPKVSEQVGEYSNIDRVFREPENCSAESNRCYQMVHIGPFFFSEHSNSEWTFGQGSVFKWQDGRKSLLKGALTVTSPSVVEIEAGSATVSHFGGRILVKRESESTLIFNISSSVVVTPLGKKVGFDLPRGFSVRVNNVGISGVAQADIIEAVRVKNLLKEWGRLATDELRFRQEVLAFRQDWRRAVELASEWQKTSVERKIASYEAEQQRRRLLREKRERENQALRQLFREKTGF